MDREEAGGKDWSITCDEARFEDSARNREEEVDLLF